jgi:hypothetical protein
MVKDAPEKPAEVQTDAGLQVNVQFTPESSKLLYVNHAIILHAENGEEFVFDFYSLMPPSGAVLGRFAFSPKHAKRLLRALNGQIERFETKFGEIKIEEATPSEG